ncbi:hypothetical protein CyaNS01_01840 [Cyanobium sp. NS01]|nr:hypothetical protein CyaNS01_01840 [Cyanobium sp. NS01]
MVWKWAMAVSVRIRKGTTSWGGWLAASLGHRADQKHDLFGFKLILQVDLNRIITVACWHRSE